MPISCTISDPSNKRKVPAKFVQLKKIDLPFCNLMLAKLRRRYRYKLSIKLKLIMTTFITSLEAAALALLLLLLLPPLFLLLLLLLAVTKFRSALPPPTGINIHIHIYTHEKIYRNRCPALWKKSDTGPGAPVKTGVIMNTSRYQANSISKQCTSPCQLFYKITITFLTAIHLWLSAYINTVHMSYT